MSAARTSRSTDGPSGEIDRSKSDYIDYPKTCAPDDFWGQVRRTVNGQPVGREQIAMIVEAIGVGLDLRADDAVLDIACGNGALSAHLFDSCRQLVGIDHSEYLIEVAERNFARSPDYVFLVADAAGFVTCDGEPDRFTKVLCYGSFSFLSDTDARTVLERLDRRFSRVERIYLGNLPDRERAALFYSNRFDYAVELDDHRAQIGVWRSPGQLERLARSCGWTARIHRMPDSFYAHHYRYDAILERSR